MSLGVPVDLDEILPASKQKKLILPSISLAERSPRGSTDSRPANAGAVSRLKEQNDSNVSVDSAGNVKRSGSRRKHKEEELVPRFDASEALRLGKTTEVKLQGMNDEELQAHVKKVEEMGERAREVLGYWQRRADGEVKQKEAFEAVIENLVSHARKARR